VSALSLPVYVDLWGAVGILVHQVTSRHVTDRMLSAMRGDADQTYSIINNIVRNVLVKSRTLIDVVIVTVVSADLKTIDYGH